MNKHQSLRTFIKEISDLFFITTDTVKEYMVGNEEYFSLKASTDLYEYSYGLDADPYNDVEGEESVLIEKVKKTRKKNFWHEQIYFTGTLIRYNNLETNNINEKYSIDLPVLKSEEEFFQYSTMHDVGDFTFSEIQEMVNFFEIVHKEFE